MTTVSLTLQSESPSLFSAFLASRFTNFWSDSDATDGNHNLKYHFSERLKQLCDSSLPKSQTVTSFYGYTDSFGWSPPSRQEKKALKSSAGDGTSIEKNAGEDSDTNSDTHRESKFKKADPAYDADGTRLESDSESD